MNKDSEQVLASVLIIGGALALLLGGMILGANLARLHETDRWQREAVKMDKARWVTDEEGDVDWAWKP